MDSRTISSSPINGRTASFHWVVGDGGAVGMCATYHRSGSGGVYSIGEMYSVSCIAVVVRP